MKWMINDENILNKCFNRLGDLIVLNVLFILFSIPIVTIGASFTALSYCCLKIVKERECSGKIFFKAFKENFKPSTQVWVCYLIIMTILLSNLRFLNTIDALAGHLLRYLSLALLAIIHFTLLYLLPAIAVFNNQVHVLVKDMFILSLEHIVTTILILVIWLIFISLTISDTSMIHLYLFLWLTIGFSTVTLGSAYLLYQKFKKYL